MRVLDCHQQNWSENVLNMSKLRTYALFKTRMSIEPYLLLDIPHRFKRALSNFRLGLHDLEVEVGRHKMVPPEARLCKLCASVNKFHIDDEFHVICACSFYADLRNIYLSGVNDRNLFDFVQ